MTNKLKIYVIYNHKQRNTQETDDERLAQEFVEHMDNFLTSSNDCFEFRYFHKNPGLGRSKFSFIGDLSESDIATVVVTPEFEKNKFLQYMKEVAVNKRFEGKKVIPIIVGKDTNIPDIFYIDEKILDFDSKEYKENNKDWDLLKKFLSNCVQTNATYDGETITVTDGIELRKKFDNSFNYGLMKKLIEDPVKIDQRVGLIEVGSYGTGFRVGDAYIASAYHIFKNEMDEIWVKLYHKVVEKYAGGDLDEFARKLGSKFSPETETPYNAVYELASNWKRGFQVNFRRSATFKDFADMGIFEGKLNNEEFQNTILEYWSAQIKFSFIKEEDPGITFKLDHNIAFYDEVQDVIILKLVQEENKVIPPPFVLDVGPIQSCLHLFGHPDGNTLIVDPKCEVYSEDQQDQLNTDKKCALEYCTNNSWWCNNANEDLKTLEQQYQSMLKSYQNHKIILHCSESIMKGASGSPVIRTDEKADNSIAVKVQAMLLGGHPRILYDRLRRENQKQMKQRVFFEEGISMKTLHSILDVVPELRNHLFSTTSDQIHGQPLTSPSQDTMTTNNIACQSTTDCSHGNTDQIHGQPLTSPSQDTMTTNNIACQSTTDCSHGNTDQIHGQPLTSPSQDTMTTNNIACQSTTDCSHGNTVEQRSRISKFGSWLLESFRILSDLD